MKEFIALINELDVTTKNNKRIKALEFFFNTATADDKLWGLALICGNRPKRAINSTLLRTWAAEKAQVPLWLFEECYHVAGDLGETIALLVAQPVLTATQSLTYWMQSVMNLSQLDDYHKKEFVLRAWDSFDYYNCFVFNKIITGGFRIGVSDKFVFKALANHLSIDEKTVAHLLSGNWKPENTTFESLLNVNLQDTDISKPYPFFLAYPIEKDIDTFTNPTEWQAEWKWDGLRGQLIKRKGELFLWSRGEELITDKFPEFLAIKGLLPDGIVLDGEIICWRDDLPLPFQLLQTRIGRKNVTPKILNDSPVIMLCYDILEFNGVDLRNSPLQERRKLLESVVTTVSNNVLKLSQTIQFHDFVNLADIRQKAFEMKTEGLMLKRLDSIYDTGRRKGAWWKWKIDPMTIDGVLIYAQKGHGRRADLYTDYTFALWHNNELVPFTKAYSGLTDKELVEVDKFVKSNTKERFGPVRSVTPMLVFELAFEGINISTRHKSGVALRFPRILRWRRDKKISDANTLDDLKQLANT